MATQVLTIHWVGYCSLLLFVLAYALVLVEEYTHLRKSKPVILAAGIIWGLIAFKSADQHAAEEVSEALRHALVE
ncbi:MAG: sodium:proton antiporter, partial [Gammaproteobacteria bacterium]|nr:sodium:proton antiporter [Gammaproteobacteria bacterium]